MPKMRQLTLGLASKPGVLAHVTAAPARAGVNITAICAGDRAGARGKIRILVDNPARAVEALRPPGCGPARKKPSR
jgi:hypothetical protein